MKKKSFWKDTVTVGLALSSTMFGAGNLIFPPQIGLFSGQEWFLSATGLLLDGIVLPVTALWAVNNVGEGSEDLMGHVSPWCYNALYLVSYILIAMGSTLPKSAATTYEIGIQSLFPQAPNWAAIIVLFVLVYFLACDRESVIDKLGKYMTPILLVLLAIVLIKGVVTPAGEPVDTGIRSPFGDAMLTAYNTGDLTVGIMFASVTLGDLRRRGYDGKESQRGGFMTGIVCIIALFAAYGTPTYIGATASGVYAQDTVQTAPLSGVIRQIMGTAGLACMGDTVAMACLTTAVGIGATVVSFIYEFLKKRVPYRLLMLIACITRVFMGITGVQNIVNYVTSVFLVIYPVCIVMTILGLPDRSLPNNGPYKGDVSMAGIVSLGDAVLSMAPGIGWLRDLVSMFLLSDLGLAWLAPTVIGTVMGALLRRGKEKYQAMGNPIAEKIIKNE